MKKRFLVTVMVLLMITAFSTAALGLESQEQDAIRVFVDGEQLVFDVQPIATSERVLAPMGPVLDSLGYVLDWEPLTMTASAKYLDQIEIVHVIGTDIVYVNGEARRMDVASLAMDGRTMVPLRFFSEILNYSVEWNGAENAAYIDTGAPLAPPSGQLNASSYFPMTQGNSWDLSNGGFENSGFKENVSWGSGPYYQTWWEVPGISQDVKVYEIQPDMVKIIFREQEEPPNPSLPMEHWATMCVFQQEGFTANVSQVVLQGPIAPGTEWSDDYDSCTIVSVDEIVETPAGTFDGCVKVERVSSSSDTVIFDYYSPGVGPVKRDYVMDGQPSYASSLLEAYTVK